MAPERFADVALFEEQGRYAMPLRLFVAPMDPPVPWTHTRVVNWEGVPVTEWYRNTKTGISVCRSVCRERDGKLWLHVSFSQPSRLPSWQEVTDIKNIFVGKDRFAYQILPPSSSHANYHNFCLHLWHCMDETPLPDFTTIGEDGKPHV